MRLLVTGGLGFIGSNFVRFHCAHYPDDLVINFDAMTYAANKKNLADLNSPNYRFYQGNICNQRAITQVVNENHVDLIINFAAESHVDRSISDPTVFIESNIKGVSVLTEVARKKQLRLIQISTDEVYGSLPNSTFAKEDAPLNPSSPYAASKAAADLLVMAAQKTHGLKMNVIRSTNNYGPYQNCEKFIPLVITHCLTKKPFPIYGNGDNRRIWLYVEDNVRAIETIVQDGVIGEVYNVGSKAELSNVEVSDLIMRELKASSQLSEHVLDRLGHDFRYGIDFSKIQALGWKPTTDFPGGIKRTIEWYEANPDWWNLDDKRHS